jgi:hypothetical protein
MILRAIRLIATLALSVIIVAGVACGKMALWFDGPPVVRACRDHGRRTCPGQHLLGRSRSTVLERTRSCAAAGRCFGSLVDVGSTRQYA